MTASAGFGSRGRCRRDRHGAAATCRPVRISDFRRSRRYVNAVGSASGITGVDPLPLPALASLSQLAVSMARWDGSPACCSWEAEQSFAFRHRDEEALCILAGHLALSLTLAAQERERLGERGRGGETGARRYHPSGRRAVAHPLLSPRRVDLHRQRLPHPWRARPAAETFHRGICEKRPSGFPQPRNPPRPEPAAPRLQGQSGNPSHPASPAARGKKAGRSGSAAPNAATSVSRSKACRNWWSWRNRPAISLPTRRMENGETGVVEWPSARFCAALSMTRGYRAIRTASTEQAKSHLSAMAAAMSGLMCMLFAALFAVSGSGPWQETVPFGRT